MAEAPFWRTLAIGCNASYVVEKGRGGSGAWRLCRRDSETRPARLLGAAGMLATPYPFMTPFRFRSCDGVLRFVRAAPVCQGSVRVLLTLRDGDEFSSDYGHAPRGDTGHRGDTCRRNRSQVRVALRWRSPRAIVAKQERHNERHRAPRMHIFRMNRSPDSGFSLQRKL